MSEPNPKRHWAKRPSTILAVLAGLAAYNSSDWYSAATDHFQWRSEHYRVGSGPCWNCGDKVVYWQEKGKAGVGVESVCENCNLTSQLMGHGYSFSQTCWNCGDSTKFHRALGQPKKSKASTTCKRCGVANFATQTASAVQVGENNMQEIRRFRKVLPQNKG